MKTHILELDPADFDPALLEAPADALRRGGLVVVPTETVYGIGANLDDPEAFRRLLEVRRSPAEKAVTVHISSRSDLGRFYSDSIPLPARRLIRRFWPGPLTLVLPTPEGFVGFRYPDHRIACELIRRAGVRVGIPSANRSGEPPATDPEEARRLFEGSVDYLIAAGPSKLGRASTVVRIAERSLEVLREGAIARDRIAEANARVVLFVCTGNTCRSPMAERLFRMLLSRRLGTSAARGFRVVSAGTAAGTGASPSTEAQIAVRERGGDLAGHTSQPLSISMAEDADRIFVMTEAQRRLLEEWMPDLAERIELLDPEGKDIQDPIGGTLEIYRKTADRILQSLERRMEDLTR